MTDTITVWSFRRHTDNALIWSDDEYALEYDLADGDTKPIPQEVKREWYEALPEDFGP